MRVITCTISITYITNSICVLRFSSFLAKRTHCQNPITAFLQPLHEKPWHFFNCTRYGLAEWFKAFETEQLHVSKNFCPNHTVSWIASELEAAFRKDVSPAVGRSRPDRLCAFAGRTCCLR